MIDKLVVRPVFSRMRCRGRDAKGVDTVPSADLVMSFGQMVPVVGVREADIVKSRVRDIGVTQSCTLKGAFTYSRWTDPLCKGFL